MSRKIVTELTTPREHLGKRKGYLQEVFIRSVTEVTTSYLSGTESAMESAHPVSGCQLHTWFSAGPRIE